MARVLKHNYLKATEEVRFGGASPKLHSALCQTCIYQKEQHAQAIWEGVRM